MAYEDARARVKTVLEGVAITTPLVQSIKRVYEDPPGSITDLPCFVLYGSSGQQLVGFGSGVAETHSERARLLLQDADLDRAARLVRAYRAAVLAAFKAEAGLNGHGVVTTLSWEEPSGFTYGGKELTGMDFLLTFQVRVP